MNEKLNSAIATYCMKMAERHLDHANQIKPGRKWRREIDKSFKWVERAIPFTNEDECERMRNLSCDLIDQYS